MDEKIMSDLSDDWSNYIRKAFFSAWEISSPVDLTDYAFLFEHHFDLNKISLFLRNAILDSSDREKTIRYHKNRIRTLAHIFIASLLEISDDGKHITSKNIKKAKLVLEEETRCNYDY